MTDHSEIKVKVPLNQRGKAVRSIRLGGIGGGIESRLYDRVNISEAAIC